MNDPIHRWYQTVMGFSPSLVRQVFSLLKVDSSGQLLDPFCGAATALVEAKLHGISSIGIDANPFFVETAKGKTNWCIDPERLFELAMQVIAETETEELDLQRLSASVVERRWIRASVWNEAMALSQKVRDVSSGAYSKTLNLALAWSLKTISNMKYGPEPYRAKRRGRISVKKEFRNKVREIYEDLLVIPQDRVNVPVQTILGDSRSVESVLQEKQQIKWVLTSPPYPTEHDYTRISRMELEFTGFIRGKFGLNEIKQMMLRSSSKNVYKTDHDYDLVSSCTQVKRLVKFLEQRAKDKDYNFAKKYPKVVGEYFGGIYRHLSSLAKILPKGAKCAYVVGEQRSFLGCFIPTASVMSKMCQDLNLPFKKLALLNWRTRVPTTGARLPLAEQILILGR